ncbi:MAG: hypothetical protein FJ279_05925 [Planctomycetes bacterium]|nr:hypothetical protein [Planctomycetota bacterium]
MAQAEPFALGEIFLQDGIVPDGLAVQIEKPDALAFLAKLSLASVVQKDVLYFAVALNRSNHIPLKPQA